MTRNGLKAIKLLPFITQCPSSRYMELAKEIPICLKRLKIFHKFDDENYVPDEAVSIS
ncbi:hypothetical protein [Rickettsia helvetica]|uniref:Uncharacterized protein n=1 Tax=Rickettsia helvetica TaxID=35789 RepID=A0ABP0T2Y5_RICHE|nr:hypothetical protein [Rickettsia helvetica]MCZ6884162.1 hypothetical protein [Rickettsia endosymbiont of Ixodes ricinus]MCZ6896147.1 hypothetical protein [Rickettsia endosymbiont of Ixodes ricinus]